MFLSVLITVIQLNGDGDVNQRPAELANVFEGCWQHCSLQQGAKHLPYKRLWLRASVQTSVLPLGVGSARGSEGKMKKPHL